RFAENTGCRGNQQNVAALLTRIGLEELPQTDENACEDMIDRVVPLPERHDMKRNITRLPRSCIGNECIDTFKPLERLSKKSPRVPLTRAFFRAPADVILLE